MAHLNRRILKSETQMKVQIFQELNSAESVESLRDMLLRVDCGMRRTLFVNQVSVRKSIIFFAET